VGAAGLGLAVVGGGPAGCAAAAAARIAGMDVVLYTAGPSPRMRPVESLPPGTAELVAEIFGARAFRPDDHLPGYANRSRWGSDALETADFVFNPLGHGWHVRRPAFDEALLDAVRAMGVRVVERRLRVAPAAPFVIDASGRSARIARARGARRMRGDRLVAVFRQTARTGSATAVVAAENGWAYTSPGIAAFLTDADLLPRMAGCVTDASTSWLDRIVGAGWAATGDAAAAFDPLSSQGIVTGLVMGHGAGRVAAGTVSPEDYEAQYTSLLEEHLALLEAYYGMERRWPDSPFWARRQRSGSNRSPLPSSRPSTSSWEKSSSSGLPASMAHSSSSQRAAAGAGR
jgi:flavin-dependent dehydrogenase